MAISTLDIVVLAVYLIGITAFGIWIGFRRHASSEQYFLANKSLGWFTVGAAVFTSNISTIHLVGLAAGGAKDGMVIGNFDKMTMNRGEQAMRAEFERLLPMMRAGGFIPSVDHQTPPGVSLDQYRSYLRLLDEYTAMTG